MSGEEGLVKTVGVLPFTALMRDERSNASVYVTGLKLLLEDGRTFTLLNIPPEVAEAIKIMNDGEPLPRRQSLFALLINHEGFKDLFSKTLEKVVIDELDPMTGLYTATVYFHQEDLTLKVKMIPSHAIYLAMVSGKPIYVKEELVENEEAMRALEEEGEEEEI